MLHWLFCPSIRTTRKLYLRITYRFHIRPAPTDYVASLVLAGRSVWHQAASHIGISPSSKRTCRAFSPKSENSSKSPSRRPKLDRPTSVGFVRNPNTLQRRPWHIFDWARRADHGRKIYNGQATSVISTQIRKRFGPKSNLIPLVKKIFLSWKFVFVRRDMHKTPLQRSYEAPFKIIKSVDKFYKILIGDHENTVTVDRLKPTFIENPEEVVLAGPRRRGRPP